MARRSHNQLHVWLHFLLRRLHIPPHYFLVVVAGVVGWLTAWTAHAFQETVIWIQGIGWSYWNHGPVIVLMPAIGGLICGLIVSYLAKEAKGQGIPEVMAAVLLRGGVIPMRMALAKLCCTVASVGSMGAAGLEGPIVQIGAALGSGTGQWLRLSASTLKILVGCGAAAGISAMFHAPIGGVLFALEVILGTFSPNTFTPIMIASIMAFVTMQTIGRPHQMMDMQLSYPGLNLELLAYLATGLFCGLVSVIFIRSLVIAERKFGSLSIPAPIKPALGGALLGILMLQIPIVGGSGEMLMEYLVGSEVSLTWLCVLLVAKLAAICLTLGSGGSGGVFFPGLVLGAISGLICHNVLQVVMPLSDPRIYMLVGMSAVVSGTTHGPIAAIVVLCELSGHFSLILPLMITSIAAVIVARSLYEMSIYGIKLRERGIHLKDGHDLDVLRTFKVRDLMNDTVPIIDGNLSLREVILKLDESPEGYLLVQHEGDTGLISHHELIPYLQNPETGMNCKAYQAMMIPEQTIHLADAALIAHETFALTDSRCIPVCDSSRQVCGLIFRKDIMRSYKRALHRSFLADRN